MKKLSNMGGGEFEYEPQLLDKKVANRKLYFSESLKKIENDLEILSNDYMKQGLGTKENFTKDIIRELILKNR